jgi:hypothetical protein
VEDPGTYREKLGPEEAFLFATLLPGAAAFQRRRGGLPAGELFEALRARCVGEIDRVLGAAPG